MLSDGREVRGDDVRINDRLRKGRDKEDKLVDTNVGHTVTSLNFVSCLSG